MSYKFERAENIFPFWDDIGKSCLICLEVASLWWNKKIYWYEIMFCLKVTLTNCWCCSGAETTHHNLHSFNSLVPAALIHTPEVGILFCKLNIYCIQTMSCERSKDVLKTGRPGLYERKKTENDRNLWPGLKPQSFPQIISKCISMTALYNPTFCVVSWI